MWTNALRYDPDVARWTLAEVADRGTLVFECRRCRRLSVADGDKLAERFGVADAVERVQRVMRCRRCGTLRPDVLVRLKVGRGDSAWWRMPPRLGR